ncbi:aspartic peptidase A1 family protein, partial [Tanacetum coccineum]
EAVLQKLKYRKMINMRLHLSSLCFSVNVGAADKVRGGYEYYGSRGRGVRRGMKRDRVTRDLPTPTQSPRSMSPVANSSIVVDANEEVPDTGEKFALCLPSSSLAPGVTFLGEGPYYFLLKPNLNVMSILSYTPMIRKTSKSLGYYIKISNILIRDTPITLPSLKSSPAKLSTLVTYTTFRSDIYKALLISFSKATKNIPRVKAVKPFSLCMKASVIRSTNPKFSVPNIDLEMESGKIWTISANNSIKTTGNGISCLAFIDGGSQMEEAVVMGTCQMENNFLFFDMENQKLGFSSSMLARGIVLAAHL